MTIVPEIKGVIGRAYRKVYAGNASLVGRGLELGIFSRRKIKKGEIVFIAKGKLFKDTIEDIDDSMEHRNAIGIDPDTWLEPQQDNPLRYTNHSCDPNLGIKGSVSFVALRNIRKGEHLTVDYSITECDILWNFKIQTGSNCMCGSKNCRKVIRSIQFLPERIYRKYLPYIPRAFQKVYKITHS